MSTSLLHSLLPGTSFLFSSLWLSLASLCPLHIPFHLNGVSRFTYTATFDVAAAAQLDGGTAGPPGSVTSRSWESAVAVQWFEDTRRCLPASSADRARGRRRLGRVHRRSLQHRQTVPCLFYRVTIKVAVNGASTSRHECSFRSFSSCLSRSGSACVSLVSNSI